MDLIDEIAADIKSEENFKIISKYLPWIIISVFFIILILVYYNFQENNKKTANLKFNDQLFNSLTQKNKSIDSHNIKNTDNYYRDDLPINDLIMINSHILRVHDESSNISKNEFDLSNYENIIKNNKTQELTRAYCYLLWLNKLLTFAKANIDLQKIEDNDSFEAHNNLFFKGPIKLTKALLYIKNENKDKAYNLLMNLITDESISSYVKENARILMANL